MKKTDMSSEAITRRLRQTDQLRELSLSLIKAKRISDDKKKSENSGSGLGPGHLPAKGSKHAKKEAD